jgi:hypothetical protein
MLFRSFGFIPMSDGEDKGAMKPKGLNSIVNIINKEHLCLKEKISEQ